MARCIPEVARLYDRTDIVQPAACTTPCAPPGPPYSDRGGVTADSSGTLRLRPPDRSGRRQPIRPSRRVDAWHPRVLSGAGPDYPPPDRGEGVYRPRSRG